MTAFLALRDKRLRGGVPARANLRIINTTGSTPLHSVFAEIRAYTRHEKIHTMFILCHGFSGTNDRAGVCMDAGGQGLLLGSENVLHSNVSLWSKIADKVQNIVVYACAAGNTEPGNERTTADGRYLMGALAIHANATVYAADRIQWYSTYHGLSNGRYEFGKWEGNLWCFPPSGNPPYIVGRAPVEFADVM